MIAGIVLGGGEGRRIGHAKAWLRTDKEGECFFGRACALLAAAGAHVVIGVVRPGGERLARLAAPGATVVTNEHPETGQLSSLQEGLRAAQPLRPDAIVVLPVDVPLVSIETVRALVERWKGARTAVVRPVSGDGRHGHPVVFARGLFDELMRADPRVGAKAIVRSHVSAAGDLLVADEGAFFDVDTVDDYVRAFNRQPESWTERDDADIAHS